MTRLFTVHVHVSTAFHIGRGTDMTWYSASFAGIEFTREREADLIKYVRLAARNIYGHGTQIIFLHTER
jgi:hypothetical protein